MVVVFNVCLFCFRMFHCVFWKGNGTLYTLALASCHQGAFKISHIPHAQNRPNVNIYKHDNLFAGCSPFYDSYYFVTFFGRRHTTHVSIQQMGSATMNRHFSSCFFSSSFLSFSHSLFVLFWMCYNSLPTFCCFWLVSIEPILLINFVTVKWDRINCQFKTEIKS